RVPFFRRHPSLPLTLAALGVVAVGAILPATPLAGTFGFHPLPPAFFAALGGMALCYLGLIEVGKKLFYRVAATKPSTPIPPAPHRHLRRRAARFSIGQRFPAPR
ncbi:magnesium-translocating P-type ATPase, partial [Amycolatopsis sp. H20-H5]|nr:magnesium-translocating P-type ATPase [Amycolatopsis sp. H20-H5]